jgi:hypothetical protein
MRHIVFYLLTLVTTASAQSTTSLPTDKSIYIIGVKPSPPFVIKHDDGSWSGISIALWLFTIKRNKFGGTMGRCCWQGSGSEVVQLDPEDEYIL